MPGLEFWYPIPISEDQSTQLATPLMTPYISCETHRAWLDAYPPKIGRWDTDHNRRVLTSTGAIGAWGGELTLHDEDYVKQLFPDDSFHISVELVAISRGFRGGYNVL
jgi:hypothetical protein